MQQIKAGQEAVSLQNPYTDTQMLTIAENLIEITRFYTVDYCEWNRTNNAQKLGLTSKHIFRVHLGNTGTVQSSNASPKQCTCGSIGLGIEAIGTNSTSIENLVQPTGVIIPQNTSPRPPHNRTSKLFARSKVW